VISRRSVLTAPLALAALQTRRTPAMPMTLGMHLNTSSAAGYQHALEGWAKAGIKNVELTANHLDEFMKTNSLQAAKRVLTDNGLTPVSANAGAPGIFEPNPKRAEALENLRHRCQQFAELGLPRIYQPSASSAKFTLEDFKAGAVNMREVGEIAKGFNLTFMVEAPRNSTFIASLSTLLKMTRDANHPSLKPMFDFYHFWTGPSRMEDLESVRPGEIAHVHFQDVPDIPREMLDQTTREIPGDGIAPVTVLWAPVYIAWRCFAFCAAWIMPGGRSATRHKKKNGQPTLPTAD